MISSPSPLERAAARNVVRKYLQVKRGENVIIESWTHTLSMASAMVDAVRQVDARATLTYENDDAWWRAVDRGQTKLLGRLSEPDWAALKAANVFVNFWGPEDSGRLEKVPEKRIFESAEWFDRWYGTARSTGLRGVRMGMGFVTDSRARHWGVRKQEWMKRVLEGCLADPGELARSGQRLARAFTGAKSVRITHPNGTDLKVGLASAPPRVHDGRPHSRQEGYGEFDMMANVPAGRFLAALDSRTAEGRIVATHPSYDLTWYPWQVYSGGEFEFSGGKLNSFSFEEGEAEFAKHYAKPNPGRDRTGYLSIGLNPKARDLPHSEDIQRGRAELTIGNNTYSGGRNHSDFAAWLTVAGSEIKVDGKSVVRAGKIL